MAQAFTLAEKMFLFNGRKNSMSAVMTPTDGKPAFLVQTYEQVLHLEGDLSISFFTSLQET